MTDTQDKNSNMEPETGLMEHMEEEMSLDDARRVKVLSPGMLVLKRFLRNRLAVVGLVILVLMFLFSFVGPLFSPYTQAQVFTNLGTMSKDYAGAIYNTELRYTVVEGETFGSTDRTQFLLALGKNTQNFSSGDINYSYTSVNDELTYRIVRLDQVAEVLFDQLIPTDDVSLSDEFIAAYDTAVEEGLDIFSVDDTIYRISEERKSKIVSVEGCVAIASLNVYDAYSEESLDIIESFPFLLACESAIAEGIDEFTVDDLTYTINYRDGQYTILDSTGDNFAEVSGIIVNPLDQSEFLTVEFKSAIREGIYNREEYVDFTHEDGETIEYQIERVNQNYYIKKETITELISMYELPSINHPLGLDNNGMDVMTRLMYGGRVSLMVGFVVVIIETVIGVIIGGISGYFGGKVDTALMRFVDLFNSIPFYPIVIIFGSVMDILEVEPMTRIFTLMAVLGILGWTGVARVVRGQILSLREQDFMVATEATGIRTNRRIFRHLIPNVMPLLIVSATAGLGGIIITEATLGFLGLGVKYPLASWGSIINVASDPYVMTNFWFMWIPAGMLILLTVLGFNFIGDGLRDAFDPKMKR